MKRLSYNIRFLKNCRVVLGVLKVDDSTILSFESIVKERPDAKYAIVGFNDLARHIEDEPVLLHVGQVSSMVLDDQGRKVSIPCPEYVNTEHGARSYYSIFLIPDELRVAEFELKLERFWYETQSGRPRRRREDGG